MLRWVKSIQPTDPASTDSIHRTLKLHLKTAVLPYLINYIVTSSWLDGNDEYLSGVRWHVTNELAQVNSLEHVPRASQISCVFLAVVFVDKALMTLARSP